MLNIGDDAIIRLKYSDPKTGVAVNPLTFALALQFPDGSKQLVTSLTKNADGDYQYQFSIISSGTYLWHLRTTGPRSSSGNQSFSVVPSDFEAP